tara:strand:+ start:492 stop:839 length:348 start_codon:yes stop_codon:yes gene_type:complete
MLLYDEVKQLSFKELLELNAKAKHGGKNAFIPLDWFKDNENKMFPIGKVDGVMSYTKLSDITFLIPWKFVHNEEHWRCQIMYSSDENDAPLSLDMDFSDYDKLKSSTKGEKHETH